jgi:anti-sigma regulatory factor (Ser/Thr protein kinase)
MKGRTAMATTATETKTLIALTLPSSRYSAWMARYYVRATLKYHGLDGYAEDAEMVTSELVTNAVVHTDTEAIGLELAHLQDTAALAIVVTDSSPSPPVKRKAASAAERGRGLHVVEALSARWGWRPQGPGKAVYSILTKEA